MFKDITDNSLVEQAVCHILGLGDGELAELKVQNLANKLGVNQTYLKDLFQDDQNMTIPQFIEREIMHRALFNLEKSDDINITELASRLGFKGVSGFVDAFEQVMLIKPDKYREIARNRNGK